MPASRLPFACYAGTHSSKLRQLIMVHRAEQDPSRQHLTQLLLQPRPVALGEARRGVGPVALFEVVVQAAGVGTADALV